MLFSPQSLDTIDVLPIDIGFLNTDIPAWVPSAKDVFCNCAKDNWRYANYTIPGPDGENVFVKCNWFLTMSEARTQHYLSTAVNSDTNPVVRIPRVYYAFRHNGLGYIVMEHVGNADCTEADFPAIMVAVRRLLTIPSPTDIPGPFGGGPIDHRMFDDGPSAVRYPSVADLEHHMNRILARTGVKERVRFSRDQPLVACFDDFHYANFRRDAAGNIYSVDHGATNFLPIDFQYLSFARGQTLAQQIRIHLGWDYDDCPNLLPLITVAGQLLICGDMTYCLPSNLKNETGNCNRLA